jgi:flagellar biosynthesis chaperone FliJ
LNILLESDSLIEEESFIDLSKARNSLGEMETQLKKLLRD